MAFLFLFLDGVGLGKNDPSTNPLARASMPNLQSLLGGRKLLEETVPFEGERASLVALDACLGVSGLPQSATGQATLLTGRNIPGSVGYHYGPKPNPAVAKFVQNGSLFSMLKRDGFRPEFLNAYPQRYFDSISSGLRIYSAIPMAVHAAGMSLKTKEDLYRGEALSADLTGQGWRDHLGMQDAPVLEPAEAGKRLATLARKADLAFFEFWLSDYAGHKQEMEQAVRLLETLDSIFGGLFEAWDDQAGLILITSDHGNLEDLSIRRHTRNPVPALVIGDRDLRGEFTAGLKDLASLTPAILRALKSRSRPE